MPIFNKSYLIVLLFLGLFVQRILPQVTTKTPYGTFSPIFPKGYGLLLNKTENDSLTKVYKTIDSLYGILASFVEERKGVEGIEIRGVAKGSSAEAAGLKKGDVLISLGDKSLAGISTKEFIKMVKSYSPGKILHFTGQRGGKRLSTVVKLRPSVENPKEGSMGCFVRSTTDVKMPIFYSGLHILGIRKGSSGEFWGLKEGDIITSVDNRPLKGIIDFYEFLKGKSKGDTLLLGIIRPTKTILKITR